MEKFDKKEYNKKYQQTGKCKEQKRIYYLEKVKDEYRKKTCDFLHTLHRKTGKSVRNELEILEMIDNSNDSKEVKKVYENLINLIKI